MTIPGASRKFLSLPEAVRAEVLYRVRFLQTHVWPGYAGPANDVIEMEIYEHWLEPVNG